MIVWYRNEELFQQIYQQTAIAGKRVSELEAGSIEIVQTEAQR